MKLVCLGSRPFGRHPIYVEVKSVEAIVLPGEELSVKDGTIAEMIMDKYPGCFKLKEEKEDEKMKKGVIKDKMLQVNEDKEFQ